MSSTNDDRYYYSLGKSRGSTPVDIQGIGFFQTGQPGRTVVPPLSSAFPTLRFPVPPTHSNQYSQPRSSPGRCDYNPSLYCQWPNNASAAAPQPSSSYPYCDSHDTRYLAQPSYPPYPFRISPTIPSNPPSSRNLPPLNVSSTIGREERWQTPEYPPADTHVASSSHISSPTASYPTPYAAYPVTNPANTYSYPHMHISDPHAHPHVQSMNFHSHISSLDRMIPSRADSRSALPYDRSSSHVSPPAYTPPPVTPTSPDEPMIKKKWKRANAAQRKALDEAYNRTAFPSTEERLVLAKALGMSVRSVQIWFKNKRQSMRQTNRRSSTVSLSSHQSFSMQPYLDQTTEGLAYTSADDSSMSMSSSSHHDTRS